MTASSTITSTPTCTITNSSTIYIVTITNMNATASTITAQSIAIRFINVVNYYSAITLTSINTKIYLTQDTVDLVAVSNTNNVTLTPRTALISSVVVQSGQSLTLQKPAAYNITVNFGSGMPVANALVVI